MQLFGLWPKKAQAIGCIPVTWRLKFSRIP